MQLSSFWISAFIHEIRYQIYLLHTWRELLELAILYCFSWVFLLHYFSSAANYDNNDKFDVTFKRYITFCFKITISQIKYKLEHLIYTIQRKKMTIQMDEIEYCNFCQAEQNLLYDIHLRSDNISMDTDTS